MSAALIRPGTLSAGQVIMAIDIKMEIEQMDQEYSPPQIGRWASGFLRKVKAKLYESIVAAIVGAAITTAVFFFTSHKPPIEQLKSNLKTEIVNNLRAQQIAKELDKIDFDFIDSFKFSLNSDTVVKEPRGSTKRSA